MLENFLIFISYVYLPIIVLGINKFTQKPFLLKKQAIAFLIYTLLFLYIYYQPKPPGNDDAFGSLLITLPIAAYFIGRIAPSKLFKTINTISLSLYILSFTIVGALTKICGGSILKGLGCSLEFDGRDIISDFSILSLLVFYGIIYFYGPFLFLSLFILVIKKCKKN